MEPNKKKLLKDLIAIVGKENAFTDKLNCVVYAKDPMPYDVEDQNMPYAVVRPANSEEVSKILKYANKKIIPVHVHGSGTSLIGLTRPKTNSIVLDMARMNEIEFFPERGYFEVGPGLHVALARKALTKYNALLPIFPGSELIATVGGAVSVNTSAHSVDAALCKPGDYVLGLEVVLPTGEILETGTKSARKPAGIELTKTLVGNEGILCVITKVRMRLIPLPCTENIVAYFDNSEEIIKTVMEMYRQNIPAPLFFEFLDSKTAKIGYEAVGLEVPSGAVLIATMHSSTKSGVKEKSEIFLNFLNKMKPREAKIVTDEKEWKKIWGSRSEAGNYVYRKGFMFGCELTPRVDKLLDAYREVKEILLNLDSYKKDVEFYSFGHVGAPTIHAYTFFPTKDLPNDLKKNIVKEVRKKTEGLNAKYEGCGGEWGITAHRIPFIKERYGKVYYELLVKLKKTMDPNNILNRGNLEGWM